MIVFPKDKPVVVNLNSYFIDFAKLVEHYQGEIGSGSIYLKSNTSEGAVFFNKDEIINSILKLRSSEKLRPVNTEKVIAATEKVNFSLFIYRIDACMADYWANLCNARKIYANLSTEFTNLEKLVAKMQAEKLTGYIDVVHGPQKDKSMLFLCGGRSLGVSRAAENWRFDTTAARREALVAQTTQMGGIFDVYRIPLEKTLPGADVPSNGKPSPQTVAMLEDLLVQFEKLAGSRRNAKTDFTVLLKKKFVEKADDFPFLDPFASEFAYRQQKIRCSAEVNDPDLIAGVTEAVNELAAELGLTDKFKAPLAAWSNKYRSRIRQLKL